MLGVGGDLGVGGVRGVGGGILGGASWMYPVLGFRCVKMVSCDAC